MESNKPSPDTASTAPTTDLTEPEPSIDCELWEMRYGPGGLGYLDSDDIDGLIADGQAWMPPATTPLDKPATPTEPAPRKAA